MRKITFISNLLLINLILFAGCQSKETGSIIAEGETVQLLADGFSFTEGPIADKKGNVYFTDQPNNKIYKWSTAGELSVFEDEPGRANGLYFDNNGNLLACADMNNELWSFDMKGNHTVLTKGYEGQAMNGPNDLWVHPKNGAIYFTDPLYKRDYWTRDQEMQIDGEHVYCLSPDRKTLTRVTTDLKKPNGIIGTPDGKKLYVADMGDRKTYVYDIQSDGSLANKKLFAEMGSDGMTIDNRGNIYITGRGVTVFNPEGEQIEQIPVEARWVGNVCFGGKDMKTLFITASEYLYSLKMNVKGVR